MRFLSNHLTMSTTAAMKHRDDSAKREGKVEIVVYFVKLTIFSILAIIIATRELHFREEIDTPCLLLKISDYFVIC